MRNIIEVANGVTRIEAYRMNEPVTVSIPSDEPLAIIGENGSGKSLLVDILTGAHPLWGTEVKYDFTPSVHKKVCENIKTVTFRDAYGNATGTYYQQRWNQWDVGDSNTVEEVLSNAAASKDISEELNRILGLEDLLHKKMIMLSSGELRKVQLAEVLQCEPRLVILDNPYIGLDANARQQVSEFLARVSQMGTTMIIVVVSRIKDIPYFINKVLPVENRKVLPIADKDTFVKRFNEAKVCDREKTDESIRKIFDLPDAATGTDDEIIRCEDVKISYGNRTILKNFNWSVKRGEHWALSGENGAGKSTLLSLVCADNPQAYACNISLFGFKRGCGESIWDIKKKIGYVSPEMYRSYKKNLPAVDIVASGLHDSVGLYKRVTDEEREKVLFWMDIFGVGSLAQRPYLQLSSGEQRMLLLVRAFVKDPELLVLDEPFHGLDERRRMLARAVIDAFCKRKDKTLIMVTHYEEEYPASIDHKLKLKKIID